MAGVVSTENGTQSSDWSVTSLAGRPAEGSDWQLSSGAFATETGFLFLVLIIISVVLPWFRSAHAGKARGADAFSSLAVSQLTRIKGVFTQ